MVRSAALAVVALVALAAGGASAAPSPSQLAMAQNRDYDVAPEVLRGAIVKAFAASRGGDFKTSEAEGQVLAVYQWRRFVGVGVATTRDTWDVRFVAHGGGVHASASEEYRAGGAVTFPRQLQTQIADYNLLWARVEYFLGRRADWVSCATWRRTMLPPHAPRYDERTMCGLDTSEEPAPPR